MRFVWILTASVLVASLAAAQMREIQAQYDLFAKAYVKNDVTAMLQILAADYTITDENGKTISRAKYKALLLDRKKKGQKSDAYKVIIESLEMRYGTATAITKEITDAKGKARRVHRYRDVWRRVGRTWKLASTTTLKHITH